VREALERLNEEGSLPRSARLFSVLEQVAAESVLAQQRYASWMLAYEFPKPVELSQSLSTLVERVGSEEIVLYVKR